AASTTRLAYSTPASKFVKVVMFFRVRCLSASVIVSLATILSKFFVMVAIPLSSEACLISINCTLKSNWAKVWAIPLPMVPAPITAMFFMYDLQFYSYDFFLSSDFSTLYFSEIFNYHHGNAKCFRTLPQRNFGRSIGLYGFVKTFQFVEDGIVV